MIVDTGIIVDYGKMETDISSLYHVSMSPDRILLYSSKREHKLLTYWFTLHQTKATLSLIESYNVLNGSFRNEVRRLLELKSEIDKRRDRN